MSITFSFMPIGTRVIIGAIGSVILLKDILLKNIDYDRKRRIFKIIKALALIPIFSFVSIIINDTNDLTYVKYFFSIVVILGGAYLIYKRLRRENSYNIYSLTNMIALCVTLQLLISFAAYFIPSILELLMSIQNFHGDSLRTETSSEYRLIGVGSYTFFGAGLTNTIVLILLVHEILNRRMSLRLFVGVTLMYAVIAIGGIFISRTTIIGILMSVIMIIVNMKMSNYKMILRIIGIIIIFIPIWYYINSLPNMSRMQEQAFEIVNNGSKYGDYSSSSTDQLFEMYKRAPHTTHTFLIGDGYYYSESGYYYQNVDIGYYRLIYYFGVFGLLIYIYFQYVSVRQAIRSFPSLKRTLIFCFIAMLILNAKGTTDITYMIFLFLFNNTKA
jgi:hypothetical protein